MVLKGKTKSSNSNCIVFFKQRQVCCHFSETYLNPFGSSIFGPYFLLISWPPLLGSLPAECILSALVSFLPATVAPWALLEEPHPRGLKRAEGYGLAGQSAWSISGLQH